MASGRLPRLVRGVLDNSNHASTSASSEWSHHVGWRMPWDLRGIRWMGQKVLLEQGLQGRKQLDSDLDFSMRQHFLYYLRYAVTRSSMTLMKRAVFVCVQSSKKFGLMKTGEESKVATKAPESSYRARVLRSKYERALQAAGPRDEQLSLKESIWVRICLFSFHF